MPDLIVPSGTVLTIDSSYVVAPHYGLFQMQANAQVIVKRDLVLKADRAEFGDNCAIDARGAAGASGADGTEATGFGGRGGDGAPGLAGQRGYDVTIEAALAQVGGLTLIADGGLGGRGGYGARGADPISINSPGGQGGGGGQGGAGGDSGRLSLTWVRATRGLPRSAGQAPTGHVYQSNGGAGGRPGSGGPGGVGVMNGAAGPPGAQGADGKAAMPEVNWRPDLAAMLWVQAQDMGPAPRGGHGLTFDPKRGKLVMFGGIASGKPCSDTWEWDGQLWTQVADTGPSGRAYHGIAYDAVGERVLVFGGATAVGDANGAGGQYVNDTWGWDGESWIQLADTGPSPRQAPAMAADPARQRITLFSGGQIGAQAANLAIADTWEWDGDAWTQLADTGPSGRLDARLAYDSGAATLVLFGGAGMGTAASDTWAWDGQLWRQVADTGPSARVGHAMSSIGSGIVLFGGLGLQPDAAGGGPTLNDSWAWLDGAWREIQDMGPPPRNSHAMATVTDADGGQVTMFGGQGATQFQDTWRLVERS